MFKARGKGQIVHLRTDTRERFGLTPSRGHGQVESQSPSGPSPRSGAHIWSVNNNNQIVFVERWPAPSDIFAKADPAIGEGQRRPHAPEQRKDGKLRWL